MVALARASVCDSASCTSPHHLQCLTRELAELLGSCVDLEINSVITDIGVSFLL